jgi:hypothetical protein
MLDDKLGKEILDIPRISTGFPCGAVHARGNLATCHATEKTIQPIEQGAAPILVLQYCFSIETLQTMHPETSYRVMSPYLLQHTPNNRFPHLGELRLSGYFVVISHFDQQKNSSCGDPNNGLAYLIVLTFL